MKDATGKRQIGRRCNAETVQLSALFGAIYFIQGIGEPTEGLIAQPRQPDVTIAETMSWHIANIRVSTPILPVCYGLWDNPFSVPRI